MLQTLFAASTFTYENKIYCSQGYRRDNVTSACKYASFTEKADYTLESGGYRMEKCPIEHNDADKCLLIPGTSYCSSVLPQKICELCIDLAPSANYTHCVKVVLPDENCEQYTLRGYCAKCTGNWQLESNHSCRLIADDSQISNCYIYNNNGDKCEHCELGYTYDETTNKCTQIANCDKDFKGNGTCIKCIDNYIYSTSEKECVLMCAQGDVLVCGVCQKDLFHCKSFTENECKNEHEPECEECQPGYYLTASKTCEQCSEPCTTCVETSSTCTSCIEGYYYSLAKKCEQCDAHCNDCISASVCRAGRCKEGYTTRRSGLALVDSQCANEETSPSICEEFDANCNSCVFVNDQSNNNRFVCLSCKPGFNLTSTQTCEACNIMDCLYCALDNSSVVVCKACLDGFTLEDGICKFDWNRDGVDYNNETCEQFNAQNICIQCERNYIRTPCGICVHKRACNKYNITDSVLLCEDDEGSEVVFPKEEYTKGFHEFDSNCETYNNATFQCTACKDRYFLTLGECSSCPVGCKSCTIAEDNQPSETRKYAKCTACEENYENISGICYANADLVPHCENLTSSTGENGLEVLTCEKYVEGYMNYSNETVACSEVFPHCTACSLEGQCTACQSNYIVKDKRCTDCSYYGSGCTNCNATECIEHLDNYYAFGSPGENYIEPCGDERCLECEDGLCKTCEEGYFVNKQNKCVNRTSYYGYSCEKWDSTECTECSDGHYYDNDARICKSCESKYGIFCTSCGSSECTACIDGMELDSQHECAECTIAYCAKCGTDKCLRCLEGYYLNDTGVCQKEKPTAWCYELDEQSNCLRCGDWQHIVVNKKCEPCAEGRDCVFTGAEWVEL